MSELVIRGGTVVDGGAPARPADVAISGGWITDVGDVRERGAREIDVTTTVIGNCGFAIAPCRPADRDLIMRTLVKVEGMSLAALRAGITWGFETSSEYLDHLERCNPSPGESRFVCRAHGVQWSLVNGEPVLGRGRVVERPVGARPGRVLRQFDAEVPRPGPRSAGTVENHTHADQGRGREMTMRLGSGELLFEPVEGWEKLPEGWSFIDVAGVAVDARDNVYVFNRGEHPVVVFDRDGHVLRSFGEGLFSDRPHGIHTGPDDSVYCVDDGLHTVQKFTLDGKLLLTLGSPNQPAPKWQGKPFNRPTHVAVSRVTGHLYVSDGYGNSRIHKFTPDGRHVLSWGEPGIDPGQFIRPHNVVVDRDDRVYVADREAHRIQVFDANGTFIAMWNNIHRPDGICLDAEGNFFIGELNGMPGVDDAPGLGHRVSIYDLRGQLRSRFGDPEEGEGPGQFIAPHGVAVDSRGDLYVGDVAYTIRGRHLSPPRALKCFRKFRRIR